MGGSSPSAQELVMWIAGLIFLNHVLAPLIAVLVACLSVWLMPWSVPPSLAVLIGAFALFVGQIVNVVWLNR